LESFKVSGRSEIPSLVRDETFLLNNVFFIEVGDVVQPNNKHLEVQFQNEWRLMHQIILHCNLNVLMNLSLIMDVNYLCQ